MQSSLLSSFDQVFRKLCMVEKSIPRRIDARIFRKMESGQGIVNVYERLKPKIEILRTGIFLSAFLRIHMYQGNELLFFKLEERFFYRLCGFHMKYRMFGHSIPFGDNGNFIVLSIRFFKSTCLAWKSFTNFWIYQAKVKIFYLGSRQHFPFDKSFFLQSLEVSFPNFHATKINTRRQN